MADKKSGDEKKHVYDESKIKTLSSIEHIRLRTGMYIGRIGNGSHHDDGCYILLKEVIDNAIDEYIMGHGKQVEVSIEDNHVVVRDYGREMASTNAGIFVCTARGHEILARSAAADGDLDAALAHARCVEDLYRGTAYPAGRIEAHVCLSGAHRVRGEGVQAIAAAGEAVREAAGYASDLWRFDAARAALDAGMPGAVELARAAAARIEGRLGNPRIAG